MSRYPHRSSTPRRSGDVVPLEVAQRIAAERDAAVTQFDRVRRQLDGLQRRLTAHEDENRQLRQAVATLRERQLDRREAAAEQAVAALRERSAHLDQALRRSRARLDAVASERDALVSERDAITAERDAARAALERAEVQLVGCADAGSESARVEQLAADLANVRRRTEDEIEAGIRREHARLVEHIAGIRDALERAQTMLPDDGSPWAAGLAGTLDAIDRVLDREGVERVGEPGERFDPQVHEAVAVGEHPDGVADLVLAVHQVGLVYRDGGLVRPAQVTVSR